MASSVPSPVPDPEARWPRIRQIPRLDRPFLRRVFAHWPNLVDRHWTVLAGGQRSLNLRSGELVARVALDNPAGLRKETALMRSVAADLRVPKVVDECEGVALLEHVRHCSLPASERAGRSVGAAAAILHARKYPTSGFFNSQLEVASPLPSALLGVRESAERSLAGEPRLAALAESIRALWDRHEALMHESAAVSVLLHADFKPANIKWVPEERRVLVLDWEFAWSGPAVMDIGQLLRWRPPPSFVDGFALAYVARGGSLPRSWEHVSALFDLFNLVVMFARAPTDSICQRDLHSRIAQTISNVQAARLRE